MLESWLLREWASILSECVSVKFHQIDFFTSHNHPRAGNWIPEAHFYKLCKRRVIKWSVTVTFQKIAEKFKYHVKDKRFSYPGH